MSKVVLITGSTDGIGRATARRLAADGWRVGIVGRNPERCAATLAEIGGESRSFVADLSRMPDVRRLADEVGQAYERLDALVLNANTITQTRMLTPEGFEANLAIGYLGRALLSLTLQPLLQREGGQVLSVVGLDHQRLDLDDPHLANGFTARKGLMRWQWAAQVFVREWNQRGLPVASTFMPGLVRTKILANEPQPMRAFVQLANLVIGIPVERSAEEVATVLDRVAREGLRDGYFARTKLAPPRDLKSTPADGTLLWKWTEQVLAPYLA